MLWEKNKLICKNVTIIEYKSINIIPIIFLEEDMENIAPVIHLPNFGCLKTHFGTKYAVVKIGASKLVPFIIAR